MAVKTTKARQTAPTIKPSHLRWMLTQARYSQVEFAVLIGVQPAQVNRWLRGKPAIPPGVGLIAAALMKLDARVLIETIREAELDADLAELTRVQQAG
ncbi:helix-turn-helix transcriptional regulator [Lichenicola cladoniae]|uniref:Helix-turn-helix transcriptional regulator n=1 Tax=Lichenicola cladoniae TaxID=1484109 RepID=A0A6M8HRM1_9PROT|nr:helix-turn-helix transcriptional regulator [Lichenicola cladoniae]NPD68704.1 helix-turn-helix transcriptional regulator [Acetobacteraceae bacterium]QKE90861.1 helix-turn-helix transcriptional regulator [Lichenicola cladoniae]